MVKRYGFDFYMAMLMANSRSLIMLMSIFYDKSDPAETERARRLYEELCEATIEAGYQHYRTSVAYQGKILEKSPAFLRFVNTLKSAVDPGGILAPGKYGMGGQSDPIA